MRASARLGTTSHSHTYATSVQPGQHKTATKRVVFALEPPTGRTRRIPASARMIRYSSTHPASTAQKTRPLWINHSAVIVPQ